MQRVRLPSLLLTQCFANSPVRRCYSDMPQPPDDSACCGNGCQDCVWIRYWDELQDYERKQKKLALRDANKEFEEVSTFI